ncbi:MAG: MGMT family protein [Candidatus Diapherotrites archaeon]|nr:MGMT family protein [Candidatus Diapherotrites archaeon]
MPEDFNERVWGLLKKIPCGKVTAYKEIAIALGNPRSARAVGNACNSNPDAPKVPCHRVVKSNGLLGGYSKGISRKAGLLKSEGIEIKNNRIKNFGKVLFSYGRKKG